MKHIFFFFITLFFLGLQPASGQSGRTLLWEISGPGLEQPSYLFGTFHILCPEDLQVTDAIRHKVQASQRLVLELNFGDPALMNEFQQFMALPDGKTAKDFLSESQYRQVSQFFQDSLGLPFEQVAPFKPFMLSAMLYPKYLGCQPASWEMVLVQMAQAQQAEILGLETPRQQFEAIDKMPFEQQAAMLAEGIADYEGMKKMLADMLRLYKSQELEAIERFAGSYFADLAEVEKAILEDRNRNWIPQIESLAKAGPAFFAVGAAHLGGKNGVIALLREKGYHLKPLANVDDAPATASSADSELAALFVRKWRIDESSVPQTLEDILENVRQQNPEQAQMLEMQKDALSDGLRASTVEYKANGQFEMFILGQRISGTWKLSDDQRQLLRTDDAGEETANEIVEVNPNRLIIINSKQKQMVYVPR